MNRLNFQNPCPNWAFSHVGVEDMFWTNSMFKTIFLALLPLDWTRTSAWVCILCHFCIAWIAHSIFAGFPSCTASLFSCLAPMPVSQACQKHYTLGKCSETKRAIHISLNSAIHGFSRWVNWYLLLISSHIPAHEMWNLSLLPLKVGLRLVTREGGGGTIGLICVSLVACQLNKYTWTTQISN